jgi:hypothetical protein
MRFRQKETNRLTAAMIAARRLDPFQVPAAMQRRNRHHCPPKMGKVTTADKFPRPPKKALAKPRESSDLGHRVFPPWPCPGSCREGVLSDTQQCSKDPFSSNNSRLLAQLPQCLEKIRGRGDFFDFILT